MTLSIGTVLQGRYQVKNVLAQGGLGTVYLAVDNMGESFAIKENLPDTPESLAMLQEEARLLSRLNYPNLPKVFDFFAQDDRAYLVMSYIQGTSLDEIVSRQGPLSEVTALNYASQILEALQYLHSRTPPIIHRDIKPGNITITPQGNAVLSDFGIAELYRPGAKSSTRTMAVTPTFSPPEQYGQGTDARSDIYSLGATLYFVLTGLLPPEALDRLAAGQQLTPLRQINPRISSATESVILRAMALQANQRWQSAREMNQALLRAGEVATTQPLAPASSVPAQPMLPPSLQVTKSTRTVESVWTRLGRVLGLGQPDLQVVEEKVSDVEKARSVNGVVRIGQQSAWLAARMPNEWGSILRAVYEIAQRAQAATEGETLYNKQTQWQEARAQIDRVAPRIVQLGSPLARRLQQALAQWDRLFQKELAGLEKQQAIPNVYVAGSPLAAASIVFKGRRDLFGTLEQELTSAATQRSALLLYGARRMGKTSAIKQMPNRLGPNVIPVEIDLLSGVMAENVDSLLLNMAGKIIANAAEFRGVALPNIPREKFSDDPYLKFFKWLGQVQVSIGQRWILLNLDEYENLSEMLNKRRIDERIFALLRSIIQEYPRIVLLFSGAHTVGDLPSPPVWSNYLINVKTLHIGVLREEEARDLISKPISNFPLEYKPDALQRMIVGTGCHPHLLQAACREIVDMLNEKQCKVATESDVEQALVRVIKNWDAFFQDLWSGRDSDSKQQAVLRAIAITSTATLTREQLVQQIGADVEQIANRLVNRDILVDVYGTYYFKFELVQRWVRRLISRGG